jgi:hypothetical protein
MCDKARTQVLGLRRGPRECTSAALIVARAVCKRQQALHILTAVLNGQLAAAPRVLAACPARRSMGGAFAAALPILPRQQERALQF